MWADFPLFGDYNKRTSIGFDSEDMTNLFLIENPTGKKKFAFIGTPGLNKVVDVTSGTTESRALDVYQSNLFGVFDTGLYKFDNLLVPSLIGNLTTSLGFVSSAGNNGDQIMFVDGLNGYVYNNVTNTFSIISRTGDTAGFPQFPLNVVYLDGYFVVPSGDPADKQINVVISDLNNGNKWTATDNAKIQAYPGNLVGVGVVNRRLYFFKNDSTEVWLNVGASDFPFRRDNNLLFNFGAKSASGIVSGFGYLFWLANDADGNGSVMLTMGQTPKKISNNSVENLINSFTNPADVHAFVYKDFGHVFLVLSWTTDDQTLVYDVNMDAWGQMEMEDISPHGFPTEGKVRHLANCHAYFNGQHYIGSYKTPTLYAFSRNFATNNGQIIRRVRTAKHFFNESYKRRQINQLQLDMEMGLGAASGIYSNPQAYLSLSTDGGNVFGNEVPASIGKIGNRYARAIWRKKGVNRDMVAKFIIYDPINPVTLLGAAINYEELAS